MLYSKQLPDDYFASFLGSAAAVERSRILKAQIIETIRANGPMTFADFMHESLYGHHGFYSTRKGGLDQGTAFLTDTTSPEMDELFAQAMAWNIIRIWEEMGKPSP